MSLIGRARALAYARKLRRFQTIAEKILWNELRDRKLLGKKFRRQHPVFTDPQNRDLFYIADFYCAEIGLVVELDGPIHETRRGYDTRRTEVLAVAGLRVMRFKNQEVEESLDRVLDTITKAITSPPSPSHGEGGSGG